jgi:hypothetical protein
MDEAHQILGELSQLLRRYGYGERSAFVTQLLAEIDSQSFWETLAGLEFWGGSGAVWEVAPFQFTHADSDASADDYRRFQILMIELADILESKDMSFLAARNADLFRRQLEDGS